MNANYEELEFLRRFDLSTLYSFLSKKQEGKLDWADSDIRLKRTCSIMSVVSDYAGGECVEISKYLHNPHFSRQSM